MAAAVIIENGKVFLSSRPSDKPPAGWEFPGGKIEAGESENEALKRELIEELNWQIIPVKNLYRLKDNCLEIVFILAEPVSGSTPECREKQTFKWVELNKNIPEGLLENDVRFWKFLTSGKINL